MLRRNVVLRVSYRELAGKGKVNLLNPYYAWYSCFTMAIGSWLYMGKWGAEESIKQGPVLPASETERAVEAKLKDPRRPPWPLLHQRMVHMREGKQGHDDLALSWEQCKYYYPHDWLIPLELAQILKYTTPVYLQAYVEEPDTLRKEVLRQLTNVRYGSKLNRDEEEIVEMMMGELQTMDMSVLRDSIPLVPSPGRTL
jgi:hypothetical protein